MEEPTEPWPPIGGIIHLKGQTYIEHRSSDFSEMRRRRRRLNKALQKFSIQNLLKTSGGKSFAQKSQIFVNPGQDSKAP